MATLGGLFVFLDMVGLEPLLLGYEPVYPRWLFPMSLTDSIGVNICINLALGYRSSLARG